MSVRVTLLMFGFLFASAQAMVYAQSQSQPQSQPQPVSISTSSTPADKPALPTVVSINLCADQLVLAFADDSQILSLSHLSHDPAGSVYADMAKRYPTNTGHVEEVLPLQPDLVIAGQYTSRYTLQLLESVGLRVEILPIADSIEALQDNVLQVSRWLGRPEVGQQEVARMQQQLAALSSVTESKPRAAVYDPNGYTVGDNSLRGQSLKLAGWHNVATDKGIGSYGSLSLESLITLAPDALFESPYSPDTWSRGQALSVHPALKHRGLKTKVISIPSSQTICGGPWTVDLIRELEQERISMQSITSSDSVSDSN